MYCKYSYYHNLLTAEAIGIKDYQLQYTKCVDVLQGVLMVFDTMLENNWLHKIIQS